MTTGILTLSPSFSLASTRCLVILPFYERLDITLFETMIGIEEAKLLLGLLPFGSCHHSAKGFPGHFSQVPVGLSVGGVDYPLMKPKAYLR